MRNLRAALALTAGLLATASLPSDGFADPCGMVPPLNITGGQTPTIERVGAQRTWVFFKDGIETMALRPGFNGNVADFGMLIPFPSPPAIRKISDDTFAHLEAAVDPPTLQVNIYEHIPYPEPAAMDAGGAGASRSRKSEGEAPLELDEVRVISEEAIGMYQVAVLEAGSPRALQVWMEDNSYQYPSGMDAVTQDYVTDRWCFVAVKAKVGAGDTLNARPGMRSVDSSLPPGAGFDGHVQGMGFRFKVDAPVVPMRLSVFNGVDPRNVVYMLTDKPVRMDGVPISTVVRQVDGSALHANLTQPIPVKFGGNLPNDPLQDYEQTQVDQQSDPALYSRVARDLIASDLMAIRAGELALAHEDKEKALLNLSESFGLRGAAVDKLHEAAIADLVTAITGDALTDLEGLTMTVLDGIFPQDRLAAENLRFTEYAMDQAHNLPRTDPIRPVAGTLTFYH
ncbi:MAG: DUF2330 domain-containing protein [Proteobacteria bacterium]|nr:DUF2330 domain-containing protein [Pseudomonadota bacterium]